MKKTSKFLDKNSLLMLYRTLVETHLRYCNVVKGKCNETLKDRLQILQNKAARVITKVKYEDADHLGLTCQLGWLTVRGLIKLALGIFMYKSQNNLFPETAGKFHIPVEMVHSYETRSTVSGNVFRSRYVKISSQYPRGSGTEERPKPAKALSQLNDTSVKRIRIYIYILQKNNDLVTFIPGYRGSWELAIRG